VADVGAVPVCWQVAGQDLCPSALLSFRWIDKDPALQDGSSLSNNMISGAVPFEASL
jgi:hypothetical protein